jgi:hypothetical protein
MKLVSLFFVLTMVGCAQYTPVHGPVVGSSHGTWYATNTTKLEPSTMEVKSHSFSHGGER